MSKALAWWNGLKPKTLGFILVVASMLFIIFAWIIPGVMFPLAVLMSMFGLTILVKAIKAE